MEFGERLREERLRLGFNQADFAEVAGVHRNSQGNYEQGERSPDIDYFVAISHAGVDIHYVITGDRSIKVEDIKAQQLLRNYQTLADPDKAILQRLANALVVTK